MSNVLNMYLTKCMHHLAVDEGADVYCMETQCGGNAEETMHAGVVAGRYLQVHVI